MSIRSRAWVSGGALVLGATVSVAGCGSSGSGDDDASKAGGDGAGASGGAGGSGNAGGTSAGGTSAAGGMSTGGTSAGGTTSGGAGGTSAGGTSGTSGTSGAPAVHEPVQRPFWCEEYKPVDAAQLEGWVSINPSVVGRGGGNMTSPLQGCAVSGKDWSVQASGLETDGVDMTSMSFELYGVYDGPGRYRGKVVDGITVAFSHSDLGVPFASTLASECDLCINDDGLSGTVQCRALESPLGSELEIAHLPSGQFTCTGAAVKPSSVQTKPAAFTDYGGSSWLCHYLEELDCPGRTTPTNSCTMRHDKFLIDGPCSAETSAWQGCITSERPSQLACAATPGNELVSASGNCETERAAMSACRELAGVPSGAGGSGGGGTGGGGKGGGGTGGSAGGGTGGGAGVPPSDWTVTPCAATPPSCVDLPHTCGANGDGDCCESDLVPGGDFFRAESSAPATVHSFCLDKYEVSAGRMRRFVDEYPAGSPTAGSGKNPYNAEDPGWDEAWATATFATQGSVLARLNNSCGGKTWRPTASATEPEADNYPMNCVDWFVAYAFCAWDGGWLPTRLEWKFAARAGNEQRIFPWSVPPDNRQHDTTQATFACDSCDSPPLTLVGAKPPGDGLYGQSDLSGNVMEWVQDWHLFEYPEPCNDCASLTGGKDRELLGGSATSYDTYLAQDDTYYPPAQTWEYIGFRCARAE